MQVVDDDDSRESLWGVWPWAGFEVSAPGGDPRDRGKLGEEHRVAIDRLYFKAPCSKEPGVAATSAGNVKHLAPRSNDFRPAADPVRRLVEMVVDIVPGSHKPIISLEIDLSGRV